MIDEIGTEREAAAARTIAERGVQLVATAHGGTLANLLLNPTLSDLVGGIQPVTLGDDEARRRGTQKTVLERKAPPTFDVLVEMQDHQRLVVHPDVAETVDALLRGQSTAVELRWRRPDGQIERRLELPGRFDDLGTGGPGSEGRDGRGRRHSGRGRGFDHDYGGAALQPPPPLRAPRSPRPHRLLGARGAGGLRLAGHARSRLQRGAGRRTPDGGAEHPARRRAAGRSRQRRWSGRCSPSRRRPPPGTALPAAPADRRGLASQRGAGEPLPAHLGHPPPDQALPLRGQPRPPGGGRRRPAPPGDDHPRAARSGRGDDPEELLPA